MNLFIIIIAFLITFSNISYSENITSTDYPKLHINVIDFWKEENDKVMSSVCFKISENKMECTSSTMAFYRDKWSRTCRISSKQNIKETFTLIAENLWSYEINSSDTCKTKIIATWKLPKGSNDNYDWKFEYKRIALNEDETTFLGKSCEINNGTEIFSHRLESVKIGCTYVQTVAQ